ncbi:hypothetical protein [Leptospira interrogans]|uniref:hypothetical protein n=1 Tax=Leptospira interrogans TaxID=173 RepID=UPI0002783D8F|nr:hypothetical protein [Leptospira interrogans]EJP02808.1 hypothetical protein LEP1GSC007_0029 [Leptospira interrogans serovar Bulgarica str. Mallika]
MAPPFDLRSKGPRSAATSLRSGHVFIKNVTAFRVAGACKSTQSLSQNLKKFYTIIL